MSVSSETTKSGPFTLNGVTTTFGYGFKILDEDDIEFVKLATSDGEMTVLTITSVTGVGDAGGGDVVISPAPSGGVGWVRRKSTMTQGVVLTDVGAFFPSVVMGMVDRVTMFALELREEVNRSIRLSIAEECDPLPPAAQRAGKVFAFDEDGLIDLSIASTDVAAVAAIASEIEDVAAISSEITTLAGVAANIVTLAGIAANITALAAVSAAVATCAANITAIQNAPTNASNAAASAAAAATSETNAATSESNAATSAATASTQATNAATSATNAGNSATAAAASAVAAAASETSIAQALSGVVFEWDSGTADADPGAGNIRFNHATLASVTELYISETDDLGAAVGAILSTWDDSTSTHRAYLIIRKRASPANYVAFWITAAQTDAGVYRKFSVEYNTHSGSFSDGDVLGIIVERTGDIGPSGPGSGDVLATNAGSEYGGVASTFRGNVAAAPNSPGYFVSSLNAELTNDRAPTDTATISWDVATVGEFKANVVAGSIAATQLASDGVTTVKILDNNVTLAKVQQITTDRLLGRDTPGTGNVEQLTVGGGIEFTGSGGIQRSAFSGGDVTGSAASAVLTIANDAVTDGKLRNSAAVSVIGRSANSTGDPADIAAGANDRVLARTGDALSFVQITIGMIPDALITFAKLASGAVATAAEFWSNTASKLLSAAAVWSAADPVTITYNATQAIDMSTFINGVITATGNIAFQNPTNVKKGQSGCIEVIHSGGARTATWGSEYVFVGGTDLVLGTAGASSRDLIFYQVLDDSKILVSIMKDVKN